MWPSSWCWTPWAAKPEPKKPPTPLEQATALIDAIDPNVRVLTALAVGLTIGVTGARGWSTIYERYVKRIPNSRWVTPDMYQPGKERWLAGYAARYVDRFVLRDPRSST